MRSFSVPHDRFLFRQKSFIRQQPSDGAVLFITNQEEPTHEFLYGFYHRTIIRTDCCSKPDRLYQKSSRLPFLAELTSLGYTPELSNKGNVSVTLGGSGSPLVLAAHVDTLGAMVRSIKENGRLRPTTLGGHQWSTADGENCTIHTRDGRVYTGVVLNTEPSAHVADQKVETLEENMEILLDENVSSKEDVLTLGIQTGDIIAMDPRTVITKSGYIKSRFLDDKLSAAILLGLARAIRTKTGELNRKVSLLFTVYEEVGHGGCFIPQDTEEMLSVDMGCVGADLGSTERMVSICAKDSGSTYNYDLVTTLSNIAREQKLDYAIDIYPHYGSDVEASLRAGSRYPSLADRTRCLCFPQL